MTSKTPFFVLLTLLFINFVTTDQIDFCNFGLSSDLITSGFANNSDRQGEELQEIFNDALREENISIQFKKEFGESLDTVKSLSWYYNFKSLAQINVSEILPASLHCVYAYDRELFTEHYDQPIVTVDDAIKFIFNKVIYQVAKETQTHVRLPILQADVQEAVGCNFAKGSSTDEEYFFVHCIQDHVIDSSKILNSTKIIEKSTGKEICVSDLVGLCGDGGLENIVEESNTEDITYKNDWTKLIGTMNCINCKVNINVKSLVANK